MIPIHKNLERHAARSLCATELFWNTKNKMLVFFYLQITVSFSYRPEFVIKVIKSGTRPSSYHRWHGFTDLLFIRQYINDATSRISSSMSGATSVSTFLIYFSSLSHVSTMRNISNNCIIFTSFLRLITTKPNVTAQCIHMRNIRNTSIVFTLHHN